MTILKALQRAADTTESLQGLVNAHKPGRAAVLQADIKQQAKDATQQGAVQPSPAAAQKAQNLAQAVANAFARATDLL